MDIKARIFLALMALGLALQAMGDTLPGSGTDHLHPVGAGAPAQLATRG